MLSTRLSAAVRERSPRSFPELFSGNVDRTRENGGNRGLSDKRGNIQILLTYLIHKRFPQLGNLSSKSSDFCEENDQHFTHIANSKINSFFAVSGIKFSARAFNTEEVCNNEK